MTEHVYDGSPIGVLTEAIGEELQAGHVGLLVSRAGVGKSALLVHIALNTLLQDKKVLHIAVTESVDHARVHYDEVLRAVTKRFRRRDWTPAFLATERNRMIHSYVRFNMAKLRENVAMLREAAHFEADLVVLDGLNTTDCDLEAVAALAKELGVPVWVSLRNADDSVPEGSWANATMAVTLRPEGRVVNLTLQQPNTEAEALSVTLDPATMLVLGEWNDPTDTGFGADPGDCTLYSGGAKGAEAAFGDVANEYGVNEVNFTFDGHRQERTVNSKLLTERELAAGDVSLVYVSRRLHRTYNTEGSLIRKVLQTLWHMVSRSVQVFVVGQIKDDGTVSGGTGWSVELARMWNKELWVYDQERLGWYRWDGTEWVTGTPVIHSVHFTGTGTRYLSDAGSAAVKELFKRSFGIPGAVD